jgi:hypothetical protein
VPAVNTSPPPGTKLVDPFAYYAASEGGAFFDGDYVKLDQTLGWIRGQEKKSIGATEMFVAAVHDARHGYIKYAKSDGESIERETVFVWECPVLPSCRACGRTANEHKDNDKRCAWKPVVYLPLRSITDSDDVNLCFTGNGKGARKALAKLCGVYSRRGADRQGKSPVLALNSRSFTNDSGGTSAS